jgi:cytidylate kinase
MVNLFRGRGRQKPQRDQQMPNTTQVLPETNWANDPMLSGIPAAGRVVVTISRQFGSGGAEIGRILAKECGLDYIDNEIIDEVARRLVVDPQQVANKDEQTTGMAGNILEAIQSSHLFNVNYSTFFGTEMTPGQSKIRELAYLHLTQKVILEAAAQGNAVIVGRGSQFLLHNMPRTLHLYVFAPLPNRIVNVMNHLHLNRSQAEDLIEQRDSEFSTYQHHYYGSDGQQPDLYHLLINTSLFPLELAANLVQQSLPLLEKIGQDH